MYKIYLRWIDKNKSEHSRFDFKDIHCKDLSDFRAEMLNTKSGKKLQIAVVQGDICSEYVDSIVNGANTAL